MRRCFVRPLLAALLLLGASISDASSPLELRGLAIGSTEEELRTRYPELRCDDPQKKVAAEKGRFKDFWQRKQTEADLFCGTVISDRAPPARLAKMAGHVATNFEFDFIHNRLMHASASLPSPAFDRLVAALSAKYGPPDRKEAEESQSKTQGKVANTIVYWTRGNDTIRVSKYAAGSDMTSYSLTSNDYRHEVDRRRAAMAKEIVRGP
jgi:hypothetical protein